MDSIRSELSTRRSKTRTTNRILWIASAALLVLPKLGLQAAEAPAGKGHGGAKVLAHLAARDARIEKHIEELNARLAKHPNAPANIKADVAKLVTDLGTKKATVEKLEGDVQAHDRTTAKTDRAELKAVCAVTKADRQQLHADHKADKAAGKHKAK
ncbi:MAG TPA: hypothetical protein VL860_07575 [Planctomycetota bacterium]|nr:hypothetical protein [Planctomycetota bacterium]